MGHVLELYVAGDALRSRAARHKLERLCQTRMSGPVELRVIDVLEEPDRAAEAGVTETPTIIRREPPPEVRVIGDVSDDAAILAALDADEG